MSGEPYKSETYSLDAGQGYTLNFPGGYFRILEADADLHIAFDDGDAYVLPVGVGVPVPEGFKKIRIENQTGGAVTCTIAVGEVGVDDSRFSASGDVDVKVKGGETLSSAADVSLTANVATLLSSANSARREIMVSNLSTNGNVIRVGDNNVTSSRGVEISPGGTFVFTTTAAIYAFCGVSQSIGILEVS